jgi:hypothetical protein
VEKWSFEHPTIRRLTSLCRHQLSPIAPERDDVSFPVFKSFSLTTLLGFLDFGICAASKARSF